MKTIDMMSPKAPAFFAAVLLLLPFFSSPALAGMEKVPQPRFFIGAAAGYFYPRQDAFRKIYGKPLWPVELQLGWNPSRKMSVFGAVRYLETSGSTVLLAAQRPEEKYALRWRQATLRLGMNFWPLPSRFAPFLGAGVSYSFYREQWLDAPLASEGRKAGFFVQTGGRYRLGRRFHALVQIEYSAISAGGGSGLSRSVNLGGLNLSLGLTAGIF